MKFARTQDEAQEENQEACADPCASAETPEPSLTEAPEPPETTRKGNGRKSRNAAAESGAPAPEAKEQDQGKDQEPAPLKGAEEAVSQFEQVQPS